MAKIKDALVDSAKKVKRDKDGVAVVPHHLGAPYLGDVERAKIEVARAAVEGREPDLADEHPATIAGAKISGKSSADTTGHDLAVEQQKATKKKAPAKKTAAKKTAAKKTAAKKS